MKDNMIADAIRHLEQQNHMLPLSEMGDFVSTRIMPEQTRKSTANIVFARSLSGS